MEKNRMWKYARICFMAAVCALFLGAGMKAEAAPAKVENLEQVGNNGDNGIELRWNAVPGEKIRYRIEYSLDKKFPADGTNVSQSHTNPEQTYYGLSVGSKYYVRVCAYEFSSPDDWGPWSDTVEMVTRPAANNNCNLMHTESKETSITLKWNRNPQANGYRIEYYKVGNSNAKKTLELGNAASCTINKLAVDTKYTFDIYPVLKSESGFKAVARYYDGHIYSCPTLPGKAGGLQAEFSSPTSNYLDLSWNSRNVAKGYQYEIWTMAKKPKKLVSGKTEYNVRREFFSNTKFKKAQFVKIRIRPYVVLNSGSTKYSAWSSWCYTSKQPELAILNVKGGQKLSWKKVANADSYSVWISANREAGYKKVKTTTKTSLTVKKCGKSKLKNGKCYYYRIVANKKIGKKTRSGSRSYIASKYYYK